ncbi:hypothetical protein NDU88_009457 [Pleurodeles waltl]|uniref:Uncharacterized protein n=1 Tax=Pleurodeles waltl TaxID=8319 RepID=A0AAV7PTB2_PLEWA|nr:hypothetical protein NDU88_009457 [Pleurodeles waltl]
MTAERRVKNHIRKQRGIEPEADAEAAAALGRSCRQFGLRTLAVPVETAKAAEGAGGTMRVSVPAVVASHR